MTPDRDAALTGPSARLASADAPVLALESTEVRFGGVVALRDVTMSFPPGPGITGIIGPNGAGKTTLFNVMTGIVRPAAGRVHIAGEDVTGARPDQIFRRRVSRTFQGVRLFEHLTIEQNVLLAARSVAGRNSWLFGGWRGERAAARQRTHEALDDVGIPAPLRNAYPSRLSLAQRRFVEIARALTPQPSVLLLDEPAAGMNTAEKQEISRLFRRLADRYRCRIVLVEHDMKLVMTVAELIWVMNFGTVLRVGSPHEVQNDPLVIEAYLGRGVEHG